MQESIEQKDKYLHWVKVNPLENPKLELDQFPKHEPQRFEEYTEILSDEVMIGFKLKDGCDFIFDENGCWTDERGCYYNQDCCPNGWKVVDLKGREQYYDKYGQFVPSEVEDDDFDSIDDEQQEDSVDGEQPELQNAKKYSGDSLDHEVNQYELDDDDD